MSLLLTVICFCLMLNFMYAAIDRCHKTKAVPTIGLIILERNGGNNVFYT